MINGNHIRAARGWLGWSQKDLAMRAGVADLTIARIETGSTDPSRQTIDRIVSALAREGMVLTERGIEQEERALAVLDDFSAVLEDAAIILNKGDKIWFHCADDQRSSPAVTDRLRTMEKAGIHLRFTYAQGNGFFTTDPDNYRWIDPEYFASSQVQVVYGDRFVEHVPGDEDMFIMIRNRAFAKSKARQIAWWWEKGLSCRGTGT